jgi:hypothetical protein
VIQLSFFTPMAWHLLVKRQNQALMVCATLLFSLTGCIVPTPLEQEPQPVNYPPSIVAGLADPPFANISRTSADVLEFHFGADDPNLEDRLVARLFRANPNTGGRDWTFAETELVTPSIPDRQFPYRRIGAFPPTKLCALFQTGGIFYLIVADRPFKADRQDQTDGLTSENHWELTCS